MYLIFMQRFRMHMKICVDNLLANPRLVSFAHSCVYMMLYYRLIRNYHGRYSIIMLLGDICRVCRCEGSADRPLFHPCICTGSIKFIHQECLVQWLRYRCYQNFISIKRIFDKRNRSACQQRCGSGPGRIRIH